jgi:hypothetical protein
MAYGRYRHTTQGAELLPTGCRPLPPRVSKAGKNYCNEEITPLLTTGIGERYSLTISNLGHAALLRPCELPLAPINGSTELTQEALLVNSVL